MFVTTTPFEQPMPSDLAAPEERFWHTVTLSLATPWFLFDYVVEDDEVRLVQTTAIAWEQTLVEILRAVPTSAHVGISMISRTEVPFAGWSARAIARIWVACPDEAAKTGPLVLQFCGEDAPRDRHSRRVAVRYDRELLFSASREGQESAELIAN